MDLPQLALSLLLQPVPRPRASLRSKTITTLEHCTPPRTTSRFLSFALHQIQRGQEVIFAQPSVGYYISLIPMFTASFATEVLYLSATNAERDQGIDYRAKIQVLLPGYGKISAKAHAYLILG